MKERIQQIMSREGFSPSRFAEEIGIQRSAMSHILSGRNNPSLDVVMKILERFTHISSDWLLTGTGEMTKNPSDAGTTLANAQNTPTVVPEVQIAPENRKEMGVETPVNNIQPTIVEKVIVQDKPSRIVTKIMVFYSDNTFDTFVPEKSKKD
ncbi:MAG: helix-turn-helix domain-containing protein [Parabacteroides sp.]